MKKLIKVIRKTLWQINLIIRAITKKLMNWLLRFLFITFRRANAKKSGFVLPTVTMVILVVILLTSAILIRSFDRAKNASNVRINQVVLAAATPGIDRAKAKIEGLFIDPTLPRATPSDVSLYTTLQNNKYTFGDETRLKLAYDINGNSRIEANNVLEQDETLNTAWRFPFDTDNNGKYDTYTLYGIYFRSPSRDATTGQFNRDRTPIDARVPPMDEGSLGGQCSAALGTSASLVGDSGWYKSGSKLKKSFLVFVANVAITNITGLDSNKYEIYKGTKGFSGLEYQQDISRIPISNNAVWFADDVDVSYAQNLRLNGRVVTNSNLLIGGKDTNNQVLLYQVSSPNSCYYQAENSKIIVGGNVTNNGFNGDSTYTATDPGLVEVHHFPGGNTAPTNTAGISSTNKTTTAVGGLTVGYNNNVYNQRIGLLVDAALALHDSNNTTNVLPNQPTITSVSNSNNKYPNDVIQGFKDRWNDPNNQMSARDILILVLQTYFQDRVRRVPWADTTGIGTYSTNPNNTATFVFGNTNPLRPPEAWMSINSTDTGLTLKTSSTLMSLSTTEPTAQQQTGIEYNIGDRIIVGNNLPAIWYKGNGIFADLREEQPITSINWNTNSGGDSGKQRTRQSRVETQPDLGNLDRNGFWETQATTSPGSNGNTGGLRIVTNGGIYYNPNSTYTALNTVSFLPGSNGAQTRSSANMPPLNDGITLPAAVNLAGTSTAFSVVWPDSMPMSNGTTALPDLRMRATAVYHYKSSANTEQLPIACVSSYYDPTNSTTAKNKVDVDGGYGKDTTNGKSNNGVSYPSPYSSSRNFVSYLGELRAQAAMIFPNGRLANPALFNVLSKINSSGTVLSGQTLTLSEYSALDSALCALKIATDSGFNPSTSVIPHAAIKEAAFLDSRQIKSIKRGVTTKNNIPEPDKQKIAELSSQITDTIYDLPLEQRQPLEIRVTELNLNVLKNKGIGTATNTSNDANNNEEYLLPNSGIIYATREDALVDLSVSTNTIPDLDSSTNTKLVSPTDFKLDPTRRPNGIRLINGANLARKTFHRIAEKGLILTTNLPVYIKADGDGFFNKHDYEEFTTTLTTGSWDNFYTRSGLDDRFACRPGRVGCNSSTPDNWRPTTIISDSVTLLSNNFRDGFRNEGDYVLNNNTGNSAVDARLKNGFWYNNFVTTANSFDTSGDNVGFPKDFDSTASDNQGSSYLMNGVTPVQRRTNFDEYLMEYCPKLLVEQCTKSDWKVTTSGSTASSQIGQPYTLANYPAGTTVDNPTDSTIATYPRRIAYKRKSDYSLALSVDNDVWDGTPIPLGINNSGNIAEFKYSGFNAFTPITPRNKDNALWYWSTSNITGDPKSNAYYDKDKPLYIDPNFSASGVPTVDIPGVSSLNPTVSGLTFCTNTTGGGGGGTKKPIVNSTTTLDNTLTCPSAVDTVRKQLRDLAIDSSKNIVRPQKKSGTGAYGTYADFNNSDSQQNTFYRRDPTYTPTTNYPYVVNIINIPGDINTGATCTNLTLEGDANDIFIIRYTGNSKLNLGSGSTSCGIRMTLNGVSANNIFWSFNGNTTFGDVSTTVDKIHLIYGTIFFDSNGNPGASLKVDGGRIMGSNNFNNFGNTSVYAISNEGQPLVYPVLQIHSPQGQPSSDNSSVFAGFTQTKWMQLASSGTTTFNALFVTGDSPSRLNEGNGGLPNFVRFMENWNAKTVKISGSFIETRKSAYSTAPFASADTAITDRSLFYTTPIYSNFSKFTYRGGIVNGQIPYYTAPTREWGFDVALLTQLPDLFAQRFTLPPTAPPNEFFRELSQDDPWVKTLLCGGAASGGSNDTNIKRLGTATSLTFSSAISNPPSGCPTIPANP